LLFTIRQTIFRKLSGRHHPVPRGSAVAVDSFGDAAQLLTLSGIWLSAEPKSKSSQVLGSEISVKILDPDF